MANDTPCKDIVRSWTDSTCATGERLYETSDGRVYKQSYPGSHVRSGDEYREVRGGKICRGCQ